MPAWAIGLANGSWVSIGITEFALVIPADGGIGCVNVCVLQAVTSTRTWGRRTVTTIDGAQETLDRKSGVTDTRKCHFLPLFAFSISWGRK
jgi:hypothetical protein